MTLGSSPLTPHIALIGAGYWGKNLVRNFHQLGVLKTICDPSAATSSSVAR
jgi:UDP-2-acetamido-3-amino-2,3-dideoxy-glucuronate N-acetyltransferase